MQTLDMYLINIDWEIERSNQRTVELRFNKTTGEQSDQGNIRATNLFEQSNLNWKR